MNIISSRQSTGTFSLDGHKNFAIYSLKLDQGEPKKFDMLPNKKLSLLKNSELGDW